LGTIAAALARFAHLGERDLLRADELAEAILANVVTDDLYAAVIDR
jgi:hypothetical protein